MVYSYNNNITPIHCSMSNISSIFALFSVLCGVLIFGIWSNINVYAQQPSSSYTPLSPPPSSPSITISPQVKAIMCAPGSPSLKIVNTTEARICGIPKTVKSSTTAAAIPSTSPTAISSQPTTKKLPAANVAAPKQQKITTTPATSQLSKQTTGSKETTPTAVSNKPSLPSSPSPIAPQVSAISKTHQQQEQLQPATSNVPAGRNYTFATTSPAVTPDTLSYLGYQGSATAVNSGSSSDSKDKHSSDTKSSSSSGHNDNSGKSSASSSSIINDISSVVKKSFNYKHSKHSDSNDVVSYFSDNSFDDNFPFTASASSSAIAGGASASASASAGGG
jgi:hypothetical protein